MSSKHKGRGTGAYGKPKLIRPHCDYWDTPEGKAKLKLMRQSERVGTPVHLTDAHRCTPMHTPSV